MAMEIIIIMVLGPNEYYSRSKIHCSNDLHLVRLKKYQSGCMYALNAYEGEFF